MVTFFVALASSGLVCFLIVRSATWHLPFTADEPDARPQRFHTRRVPRVGGLGIMAGLTVAGLLAEFPTFEAELYWLFVLALVPAFIGGFAEDVTRRVGAWPRLLLTVITAAFAHELVGIHFVRSGLDWLDALLAFAPFGYVALLFAVAGVAHATNIIDGYNGLAAGVSVIALVAMAIVAQRAGDPLVAMLCFATAGAGIGFLLLNYPYGRLFLGDGGAYALGCVVALTAAMLVLRNPEVSPWFPFVLVVYPVWETVFSMVRRAAVYGTRIGAPDARHLHSLVYRRISRRWLKRHAHLQAEWRNPLTTLPFWIVSAGMATFAVLLSPRSQPLGLLALAFIAGYCVVYWRLARLAVRSKVAGARRRRHRASMHVARGAEGAREP